MDKNIIVTSEKTTTPLVSVIIACYNAQDYIDQCMESLVNQTYNNIEIVVCDDASKDNSYPILQEWAKNDSRIVVLKNENNLFAAATRNRCFEVAKGEYFCIQDVDDVSKTNRIEELVKEIQSENVDFISSAMQCFDGDVTNEKHVITHKTYPQKKDFLYGISFCHPATIFTRKCIIEVGGYRVSPETRRCQDYDMFMRLYAKGYKGKNVSAPLYYYRLDEGTKKRGANYSATLCEYNVRKYGFKELRLPFLLRRVFILKPIMAYCIIWIVQKFNYYFHRH